MEKLLLIPAIVCLGVFIFLSMKIVQEVSKRGVKVSFLWLRLYLVKYAHEYKKLTKQETGKIGPLFYPWLISINASLVLALTFLAVRFL